MVIAPLRALLRLSEGPGSPVDENFWTFLPATDGEPSHSAPADYGLGMSLLSIVDLAAAAPHPFSDPTCELVSPVQSLDG